MNGLSPKTAAIEALRRELGARVCLGTELLQQQGRREPRQETGVGELDRLLGGGLARGRLTEIVVPGPSRGGGMVLAALCARSRSEGHYAMLIDIGGGMAVEQLPARDLESLLWVGCESAAQAVAVFDVAVRDENFRWFLIDGRDCRPEDWREVRPAHWQRIGGPLREREAVAVLLARSAVTNLAKDRVELVSRLDLEALHREREELIASIRFRRAAVETGSRSAEIQLAG